MREYKGLFIPCEPKKEWEWMLTDGGCGSTCALYCGGLDCEVCIYSRKNSNLRKLFYKETFKDKQEETKIKKYADLFVPCKPKKEWKWMLTNEGCKDRGKGIKAENCARIACIDCIYAGINCHRRQQFYKETFENKKKETKMKKATKKGTVMELPNEEEVEFKFKKGDIVIVVNPNGTVRTYEIRDRGYDVLNKVCGYTFENGDTATEDRISHKLNYEKFSKYVIKGDNTEELKRLILLCSEEV